MRWLVFFIVSDFIAYIFLKLGSSKKIIASDIAFKVFFALGIVFSIVALAFMAVFIYKLFVFIPW